MSIRPALLGLALVLAACTRPPVSADAPATVASTQHSDAAPSGAADAPSHASTPSQQDYAPPKSTQLPPQVEPATPRGAPKLLTSCSSDADCTVKNVGSCCGAMPACVSKDSPVDPDAVKADCARQGMSSTCGFKDIQSCSCVAGTCRDSGNASTPVSR